MTTPAARRFYEAARAVPAGSGFRVELDGRPVRTPAGVEMILPTRALAEAVADEWAAQAEEIAPATMPMMQLACTAIDRLGAARPEVAADIAGYGGSDLLCYRADAPPDLVDRQAALWQPVLDWLAAEVGAELLVTQGISHVTQPSEALEKLAAAVDALDDFELTAVARLTQVGGSLVLALAVEHGFLEWQTALEAALVDEVYQSQQWGEDKEALDRRRAMTEEAEAAVRFLGLVRS